MKDNLSMQMRHTLVFEAEQLHVRQYVHEGIYRDFFFADLEQVLYNLY